MDSTDVHGRSQTAEKLVEWGLDWLDEYDVSLDDVSCILADSAEKCNRGAKDIKAGAKHLQTVTCVAHTLDNAIKQLTKQSDLMKAWRKG